MFAALRTLFSTGLKTTGHVVPALGTAQRTVVALPPHAEVEQHNRAQHPDHGDDVEKPNEHRAILGLARLLRQDY